MRLTLPDFKTYYKSYSNQDKHASAKAQKEINGTEKNLKIKSHLHRAIDFQQQYKGISIRYKGNSVDNGQSLQQMVQGQLEIHIQATNGIFHRTRTNNFTICMEIQKTSNSQTNLEKEEWNWRNQPA